MKTSLKLIPLVLSLLSHSLAEASPYSELDLELLRPCNNTTLVEDGLELTSSIAGVSLLTLINLGIWWGVCNTAGAVSRLYNLAVSDTKAMEALKTDFCLQLAPLITSAEVAVAGHVYSWRPEQPWSQSLYFAGAGMAVYAVYAAYTPYTPYTLSNTFTAPKARHLILFAVPAYLAAETESRIAANAASVSVLRAMNITDLATDIYAFEEYTLMPFVGGAMAWAVMYEAMTPGGFSPAKVAFNSIFAASTVGALSGTMSVAAMNFGRKLIDEAVAVAAASVVGAGAGLVVAGAVTGGKDAAGLVAGTVAGAGAAVAAVAVAAAATGALPVGEDLAGVATAAGAAATAGAGAGALLILAGSTKITSNNPFIRVGVTLAPTLAFAIGNSFANYAIYGYPLEKGLSETAQAQWKGFHALLNYIITPFNGQTQQ